MIVEGKVESSEGQEITVILEDAKKLADAIPQKSRTISVVLPEKQVDEKFFEDLFIVLSRNKGNCEVFLNFLVEGKYLLRVFSQPLRVQGSSSLENELRQKGCQVSWIL